MYDLRFSKIADRQLYKLNKEIQLRIIAGLERIKILPYHYVKRLVGCPYFSFRVGDYRIILDIKDDKLLILVLEMGHRRNVYKTI